MKNLCLVIVARAYHVLHEVLREDYIGVWLKVDDLLFFKQRWIEISHEMFSFSFVIIPLECDPYV